MVGANRVVGSVVASRSRGRGRRSSPADSPRVRPRSRAAGACSPARGNVRRASVGPVPGGCSPRPRDRPRPFVEQVAIAEADAVGEAASGRQRSELRIEPFAVEDEDRLLFGEVDRALEAAWLVCRRVLACFSRRCRSASARVAAPAPPRRSKRRTEMSGRSELYRGMNCSLQRITEASLPFRRRKTTLTTRSGETRHDTNCSLRLLRCAVVVPSGYRERGTNSTRTIETRHTHCDN